ncbi:G-protein beta WD- 40 repeats containing protein [Penicillium subrubescens]|uniref:G-protein beta WD- 40 repeats containing protein n=1 Tax=Penicillium subrubescens TaxID=1316194 RepID=UPI0025453D5A|nr:G-protein beta WD- 40 repeats containing protein [Penicillium subrubescens]KAJ5904783.1 G-protein beta WD- 40 repeats containing protein [Penicillium subrubescens]
MSSTIFSGTNDGLQIGHNQGPIEAKFCAYNAEDIDRFCLRELRCPDSLVVKNRLKETKDKLLPKSLEWIFQDPQYASWRSSDRVCLLWIKGGAGKGKTMMSIGLIEELTRARHESTVVSYFFCQNADNELNTLQAIIKGLLLQLVNQRIELKDSLRCRWDTVHNRFNEDVNSWRNLWNILMEMLDRCQCSKVYIIVDALDECQDNGLADFFKCIVRNGLDHPAKIKWLITSRPLDSAERALLAGLDQVQVSLELNSEYISETVEAYITHKVNELGKFQRYDETLRTKVKMELTAKAEGTFLWVSLVCKKLESVYRDDALATIRNLPPGLHPFYDRILNQLSKGEADDVQKCMRLLKVMMLAYRPLKVEEIPSLTGLTDENAIETLVNRCASLIRMQANNIEFVHQSARDYLAGKNGQSILDSCEHFGHDNILLCCLSYLSKSLKVNLLGLSQPDSTRESLRTPKHKRENDFLAGVDYAATFWVRHLQNTKRARSGITEKGVVANFLYTKLLEWLECLSLLNQLPRAIEGLKTLANIAKVGSQYSYN